MLYRYGYYINYTLKLKKKKTLSIIVLNVYCYKTLTFINIISYYNRILKMKCSKHPKYKGKHLPKVECVNCLNIYNKLHLAPRVLPKSTKVFKSKKNYTRKIKHKKI